MSKILLLAGSLAPDSPAVCYAERIARASGADIECLHVIYRDRSTAEWLQGRPRRAQQRLRRIRSRQTTAEWVQTLERLKVKDRNRFQRRRQELQARLARQGIGFRCHDIQLDSGRFLAELEKRMPADLIVGERFRFPYELTHEGILTLGDLGARLNCTSIDATVTRHLLQPVPRRIWRQLALHGAGTLAIYLLFFFGPEWFDAFYKSGGLLTALGVMATAAGVAWVYGRTVEAVLKLAKLDVY